MKTIKRILIAAFVLVLFAGISVVLLVGPWPLYARSNYTSAGYYQRALREIDAAVAKTTLRGEVAPLRAGWAERDITPAIGHPMAGYGDRANDKRSTGVHEPVFVRALALNDGTDTVVLLGTDLLQTLPNLLELIEPKIQKTVGLSNRNVMYTSSHTHCGPGGLAPGLISEEAFGTYSPEYLALLADRFAEAIAEAVQTLAPARLAHGEVNVPEFIRNRCRPGGIVDSTLGVAVVEKLDGSGRLHVARYSAHGTAYGEEMMEFNNDYCGAFQRAVHAKTGAPLLYMGGAVGAMRPNPPGMPQPTTRQEALGFENDVESAMVRHGQKSLAQLLHDQEARIEVMGNALADQLIATEAGLSFVDHVNIASIAAFYTPPPAQVRLFSNYWRMSPYLFNLLGVPTTGRLQAARIGDWFLVGLPYDFGGEISVEWQAWARKRNTALWCTSFSGAYLGYLTPDQYYNQVGDEFPYNVNYEGAQMNWFGPNQATYVTDLFRHTFERLSFASR